MIPKISHLLLCSIVGLTSASSFANALSIPEDSKWIYLTTNINKNYSVRMDYSIAPRAKLYPPDWAQVWLKGEVLDCKDKVCGSITRFIVDCEYRPKGLVQEQHFDYNIKGQRVDTDSRQKPFKDISRIPAFIKLYDTACADTAEARRVAAAELKVIEAKEAARVAKELAEKSPYDRSLPLTYFPDGTGMILAKEAYILFEDGRQVARGLTDKNGDIPYKLNKKSTYIIQLAHGKFTLDPVRKKRK